MRSSALAIACVVAGLVLVAPAGAVTPLTIGTGHKPAVAVDPAGTAYIAWFGPESNTTSLHFCRLPRGAGACDVATTIAAPGTTLSRPFVTVDGATVRVVSYRYGLTGARFDEIWEFTSVDGGATFDAGHPVGIAPFDEAVRGPGDSLTVATSAESTGLAVQNVPLDGSTAGTSQAILSADHPYNGTVGPAAPATMVAVFADASSNAQVRTTTGVLNDAATWTAPVDLGYADYPRLAGGPSGLYLLSGTVANALTVRKFDGTTFDAGVKIADLADDAQAHLTQDPAGRLHAVFAHNTVAGLAARLRDIRQRRELAVGAAADPDQRAAGHRRSCAQRPPPTTSGSRRGRPRRAPSRRSASSASARPGAPRRRSRASRWWSAWSPGRSSSPHGPASARA